MSFSIKSKLWGANDAPKTCYSPRIKSNKRKEVPCGDVLKLSSHGETISSTFYIDSQRRDALKGSTFALRQWLANIIFYHLLEFDGESPPVSSSGLEKRALDALSDNIFEFIWRSYDGLKTLDQTAFVAVFYASSLVPEGILSSRELYSTDGVLVATRLFVVTFALATKCFNDSHTKCLNKVISQSKANLTRSSAISLEFSALEVLGFGVFMRHGKWVQHLKEILTWTVKYFPGGHLHIRERIIQFLADSKTKTSIEMGQAEPKPPNTCPSSHSIWELQNKLLAGLDMEEIIKGRKGDVVRN